MGLGKTTSARGNAIAAVRLGLAGPQDVLDWSSGEVTQPTTFNTRSGRPEPGGLFCERIFGPVRDLCCRCGKYDGPRHRDVTCERCGVTVLPSRVRRRRMGHIELAAPVVHLWFFKGRPSPLAALLGLKPGDVEKLVYGQAHVVRSPGPAPLQVGQLLTPDDCRTARERFGPAFQVATGAGAIKLLLQ